MTNQELAEAVHAELKPHGFKKKGATWYFTGQDLICLLNLQKSNFGNQYYINLGISFKELLDLPFPGEHKCQIRTRLDELVNDSKGLEMGLNLEDQTVSIEIKMHTVSRSIREYAVPFLTKCQKSRKEIVNQISERGVEKFLITLDAKTLLGLS